jgi:hypothetical protein
MGDVTLKTPLDQGEAAIFWPLLCALSIVVSLFPLVFVFNNEDSRRKWRKIHGLLPWITSDWGALMFIIFNVAFLLLAGSSYWVCRGGHYFQHRIFPAISFYVTMALFATWSLPVLFRFRYLSTLIHLVVIGGFVTYTVAAFLSGTWVAGGLGCGAFVALLGVVIAWLFDDVS